MKLIDLKRPKKTKKEKEEMDAAFTVGGPDGQEPYPYGTCLRFEKEEIDKIPALETIKADQEVEITATGFVKVVEVTDASSKSTFPRSRKNVEIQITGVSIEPKGKKALAEMDNEEYRQARGKK